MLFKLLAGLDNSVPDREPENVADRLRRQQQDEQLSQPELDFVSCWKQLVDKAGGQARVARFPGWTTSTVSRDYNGVTLPSHERLTQLCEHHKLPHKDVLDLAILLQGARAARKDRLKSNGAPGTEETRDNPGYQSTDHEESTPDHDGGLCEPGSIPPRSRDWLRDKPWLVAIAVIAVIGAAFSIAVHFGSSQHGAGQAPQTGPSPAEKSSPPPIKSAYPAGKGASAANSTRATGRFITLTNCDGRQERFQARSDNHLYHQYQTKGGAWSGWYILGGYLTSDQIGAVQNSDCRLEIFGVGGDHAMWHIWQTRPGSGPWSGWSRLGGAFYNGPTAAWVSTNGEAVLQARWASGGVVCDNQTAPSFSPWTGWYYCGPE